MNNSNDRQRAFTLIELLVVIGIFVVLAGVAAPAVWGAYKSSSLAVSANNIRQLAAGGAAYLGDNNYRFWPYLVKTPAGDVYWFGLEPAEHRGKPEGERIVDMQAGPLGAYMPRSFRPDPSFGFTGKPFKPKYKFGYIGVGYNVHLAGETKSGRAIWLTRTNSPPPLRYWDLADPAKTVVFATSAQVYPFRKDAVIEEFYGIDEKEVTVHFRHNGQAMVAYANGSAGLLPMDPSTRDTKAPEADVGRFAPKGSKLYLR
jgi:prepilin-type N-terminal cleavage/methylation domain-containing protein